MHWACATRFGKHVVNVRLAVGHVDDTLVGQLLGNLPRLPQSRQPPETLLRFDRRRLALLALLLLPLRKVVTDFTSSAAHEAIMRSLL
jgi:hypothetical protein